MKKTWWKEGIVYQIYPRSFKDSNGDGIGDLGGILEKMDYLQGLGVNVIWLNPIYDSPNDDNGYDIRDYYAIMKEMGSMEQFDLLLQECHQRGIKLIMDLVVNHCSDEHFWFTEARKSRDNPYRDYFIWWEGERGSPPHRYSEFDLNNNAWEYDETTNAYYLHYFSIKQPDLNWDCSELRQEIYAMMRWWLDKGVDGFRMDVIPFISKDKNYPPVPDDFDNDWWSFYASTGPKLHDYLQEMNREVLSKYDVMTVGEGAGVRIEDALSFVDEDRMEMNMFFHFDHMKGENEPLRRKKAVNSLLDFKRVFTEWDQVFDKRGWGSLFLGNHDFQRTLSRWGDDSSQFRDASAKLLHTFLLTMRGTPFIYQGDEIGMSNIRFDSITDYRDIHIRNAYQALQLKGASERELSRFLLDLKDASRENARTPMQWDQTSEAGFTKGIPWIKVNPNFCDGINVADQEKMEGSVLKYFRKMVELRKSNPALIYGKYKLLDEENEDIYAFSRSYENEHWLIVLNFSSNEHNWPIPNDLKYSAFHLKISNYSDYHQSEEYLSLYPWQSLVFELGDY